MKHPEKWRETIDPYQLAYHDFTLTEILGYPHAGNDVFQAKGLYQKRETEVFIKVARQRGADIENEINTICQLNQDLLPTIIDHDDEKKQFVVTLAMPGERLSTIVGKNETCASLEYMYEYGRTLAALHRSTGNFSPVKDRKFFHIPERAHFEDLHLEFVHDYLTAQQPKEVNHCFCHGDFHYANILWTGTHISAILDFELSGIGNKEFDIAWALIHRPEQTFLSTQEELDLFQAGYASLGAANWDYVLYYMVLGYSYFYSAGSDVPGYQDYVKTCLHNICTNPHK